jgi:hypothetical protein
MKTSLAIVLVAALAVGIAGPAQAATYKRCGSVTLEGTGKAKYQAKGVTCTKARKVLRGAGLTLCFDNQITGWTKVWRALPDGGRALTLKRGAKGIKTNACSPR